MQYKCVDLLAATLATVEPPQSQMPPKIVLYKVNEGRCAACPRQQWDLFGLRQAIGYRTTFDITFDQTDANMNSHRMHANDDYGHDKCG